jgi:hypothetical protein
MRKHNIAVALACAFFPVSAPAVVAASDEQQIVLLPNEWTVPALDLRVYSGPGLGVYELGFYWPLPSLWLAGERIVAPLPFFPVIGPPLILDPGPILVIPPWRIVRPDPIVIAPPSPVTLDPPPVIAPPPQVTPDPPPVIAPPPQVTPDPPPVIAPPPIVESGLIVIPPPPVVRPDPPPVIPLPPVVQPDPPPVLPLPPVVQPDPPPVISLPPVVQPDPPPVLPLPPVVQPAPPPVIPPPPLVEPEPIVFEPPPVVKPGPNYTPMSGRLLGSTEMLIWGDSPFAFDQGSFGAVGGQYSQFGAVGPLALGGELTVELSEGFAPGPQHRFRLFESLEIPEFEMVGSYDGWFSKVTLPAEMQDWLWVFGYEDGYWGTEAPTRAFTSATLMSTEPGRLLAVMDNHFGGFACAQMALSANPPMGAYRSTAFRMAGPRRLAPTWMIPEPEPVSADATLTIPEPGTLALLATAGCGLLLMVWRPKYRAMCHNM